ncbi:MAG TPA: homocysteine S-methyltransferase family protein [Thermoanaerobaculia bacterium]|nr:homocysteine S-methyltransferase family protein [Thermoanaerobaculia bacterium]
MSQKVGLLERLDRGVVLGDGGYLLELEKRGYVQAGPFTPEVSLTHPDALAQLHREFLLAGADVLQALTFYASEDKLATVGLGGRADDINRAAVRIARQVAAEGDALVAGNLSLTWVYDPSEAARRRVRELFDRQLALQCAEGVDFVIGETFSWVGEALIALEAIQAAGLPAMITLSYEKEPRSYEGYDPAECARRLFDAGADVVGVNCLRSPELTLPLMAEMRGAVSGHLACQPVGYRTPPESPDFTSLPAFPEGLDPLQLTRAEMADYAVRARDLGVRYIGSCCGSVACHVRAMAKALGRLPVEERAWRSRTGKAMSAYEYYDHDRAQPHEDGTRA